MLITNCVQGAELAEPICVVAFVGSKWGGFSFRGGLVHLLKSQVRGGGVLLTNGRHKRYIPLSGLSVLLAP